MIGVHSRLGRVLALTLCLLFAWPSLGSAAAKKKRNVRPRRAVTQPHPPRTLAPRTTYSSALVVDSESGQVLFEKSADDLRAPASLTKMMTELITLESIQRGLVSLKDVVTVPLDVRTVGGSRLRLRPGEKLTLEDAVRAMAIASANDAAVVVAKHVAGSVAGFVSLMNSRARELGMSNTHYATVHGLDPSRGPGSITTARDQAILARALIEHPEALALSSTVYDTIATGKIIHTTNRLLGRCEGVDGLKTGYTSKAGFCLVSTARKGEFRVVSVLLGATSNRRRFSESEQLLNQAFSKYERVSIIRKGQDLDHALAIPGGSPPQVRLVAGEDVAVLLPVDKRSSITLKIEAPSGVVAPVDEGKALGQLKVLIGDSLAAEAPAVAGRPVRKAGLLDRMGLRFD